MISRGYRVTGLQGYRVTGLQGYRVTGGNAVNPKRAFTLIELIAVIAIAAVLTTAAGIYIADYVRSTKLISDQTTLATLNEALTRYKCGGGDLNALTIAAPIGNVITRLTSDTNWNGLHHQFLNTGATYSGRSISAVGSGKNYQFTRYNSYDAIAQGTAGTPNYGEGVIYMANGDAQDYSFSIYSTTTPYFAVKNATGDISFLYNTGAKVVPASPSIQIWACKSATDSTPYGSFSDFRCTGQQLTALNVHGTPWLIRLLADTNKFDSLDISGMTNLVSYSFNANPNLTSLNISRCLSISGSLVIQASQNPNLAYLNISGCTALISLNAQGLKLNCLNATGCTGITSFSINNNQLSSLDITGCTNLSSIDVSVNQLSAAALDAIYTALPNRTSLSAGYLNITGNPGISGDTPSIATTKNWSIAGS